MHPKLKESVYELKSIKNLCLLSFLVVVKIFVSSLKVVVVPSIQISFGFLVYIIVGCLFGPFCSFVFAILTYLLSVFIYPSVFFHFGFLISAIVSSLIYAIFLYKRRFSFKRVIFSTIFNDVFVHFFLNIVWLSQLFHNNDFFKAFVFHLPKGVVMLPIDCVLSCFVVVFVKKIFK